MRIYFLLFCITISLHLKAQTLQYKFSSQIDSIIQHDTVPWRYQPAAWEYSYIGAYHQALKAIETPYLSRRKPRTKEQQEKLFNDSKTLLASYTPVPAKEYILQEAQKTRLVIINEAHHVPRHRVFVEELLPELHAAGYNYMGLEALYYTDTLLNKRKYPIHSTGYYTKEPGFGNMIRTALNVGISVFPYDSEREVNGKEREIDQAENIKRVMDQNPNAKFIIYCGFDHAIEDSTRNSWILAMAGRLKALTGIDPLTIDQVALTETGNPTYDNFFRQVIDLSYSAVLLDSNGTAFSKANPFKTFDVNVYHPTTRLINNRPDWLMGKDKIFVDISKKINIDFPCLLLAYRKEEDIKISIPADIIELKNKKDNKALVLVRNREYVILVVNMQGAQQQLELEAK